MPVSVVVGGQYGSEGKGKVALEIVRRDSNVTTVVRPGGTNSGHTAYSRDGRRIVLRQLPAAAIDGNVHVVLPAGSYIDVRLLEREIAEIGLQSSRLTIDPRAHVISRDHIEWERDAGLVHAIGSTGSGTGAAVLSRLARFSHKLPMSIQASEAPELQPYIEDSAALLRSILGDGKRIVIEGTQGFGLSPIHGESWPKCTSRDTIAAAFLSESGLSPVCVDEIVMVIRCHPIRVAGDSGPLIHETTWDAIATDAGCLSALQEFTSVTHKLRRVGHFDPGLVRKAIMANEPTKVVLNHVDYVDWKCRAGTLTARAISFIQNLETSIGRRIDSVGTSETTCVPLLRHELA